MDSTSQGKIPQPITPREWALLPPTEYISSFTLQQKSAVGVNFNSNTNRFARHKQGSYFAETTADPSTFRLKNPFHQPKVAAPEEVPKHRPLWLSEIRKEVPAAANYNLESAIGSKTTLFKTKTATIKNGHDKYSKTCDI